MIFGSVNLKKFWKIREKTRAPVLRDLRPEVYKQLCEMKWKIKQDKVETEQYNEIVFHC